eukprot:12915117-Prorocentrum_lima.AAC.1
MRQLEKAKGKGWTNWCKQEEMGTLVLLMGVLGPDGSISITTTGTRGQRQLLRYLSHWSTPSSM